MNEILDRLLAMTYAITFVFSSVFHKHFGTLAYIIGAITILSYGLRLWKLFYRQWVRPLFQSHTRMFKKYGGEESWAVVTGGSDGIGLAMCHNLAGQGFNICIVARNEAKMVEKLTQIKKDYPKIKTMYIVSDFSKLTTMD